MAARRFVVRGRVQGVGFRYFVIREASRLALVGWTRNLPDGAVEVLASGEEASLEALQRRLGEGPPAARVLDVVVSAPPVGENLEALDGFDVRH
jgi:acylphosphatase